MIDYEYPNIFITEGTQKELLITDGTVTIDGTDYEVSDETVLFENNDLELEAFELSQTLCSEMELQFGFCGTSKVSFTVRKTYEDSIVGTTVKVYIIPNHDASKMLQLGVFRIYEDKQSNDHARHSIVGYDKMYHILNKDVTDWYDDILQDEDAVCELVDFRDSFAGICGVDEEETTLVNDDLMLKRTIEKDRISGADIIKAICEINGVFGVITNEGKFRYKQLQVTGYDPSMEIPVTDYMDLQYADYWCQPINQLTIIKDSTVKYTAGATTPQPNNYIIAYNPLIADKNLAEITQIAQRIYNGIKSLMYRAVTINAIGNPVREVGDRIAVRTKDNHILYTYIFQRKLTGIQALRDTYIANGEEYLSNNLTDKSNQYAELSNQINEITQGGGSYGSSDDFVETIRNIGFRLLDEPTDVVAEYNNTLEKVSIKWSDPSDISLNEPVSAAWAGTVVVRKENTPPLHKWDGTLIIDSTTRDAYSTNALVDDVDEGKVYYYGIFPYHVAVDDPLNPIKHYRYTKIVRVVTETSDSVVFDFKMQVQTFVAPKDGIYLLETWGAQGGNAEDEYGHKARGGYGAYAVGKVALHEGDILYINVGGQNGYNGGGANIATIHCIEQYYFNSQLLDLSIITDFSVITSTIYNKTSPAQTLIYSANSHVIPQWMTVGDLFWKVTADTNDKVTFVDSDYIKIVFGKVNIEGAYYNGLEIINKLNNTQIGAYGDSHITDGRNIDYYISIILDPPNGRAFFVVMADKYNAQETNLCRVWVNSAMYNNVDLLWETFKDLE